MADDPVTVNLLLDVGSPYSWLALSVLLRYRKIWSLRLLLRPVLLGGVMKATGNAMPSAVPARGNWITQDMKRNAQFVQVPFKSMPTNFTGGSFNSMLCQRVITAVAMDKGCESQELIDVFLSFYKGIWGAENGADVNTSDEGFVLRCCLNAGFSEETAMKFLDNARESAVKDRLKFYTEIAVKKETFGTPTMFVYLKEHGDPDIQWEKEPYDFMIFGSDRFEQLAYFLGKEWHGPVPSPSSRL